MKYSLIISDMTWSHSRLSTFENCKYSFLLKYIFNEPEKRMFFSDYGSFVHSILEMFYKGELRKDELESYYVSNFCSQVKGKAPTVKIFTSYFNSGAEYFKYFSPIRGNVIDVEKEINFKINDKDFIGYVDLLLESDGKIYVVDNKSRKLKKRSNRKKPTISDIELDKYFRQLYIYSYGVMEEFGKYPETLCFNCFRTNEIITERFDEDKMEETKDYLITKIDEIVEESEWEPNINEFFCKNLCDVSDSCEYYELVSKNGGEVF